MHEILARPCAGAVSGNDLRNHGSKVIDTLHRNLVDRQRGPAAKNQESRVAFRLSKVPRGPSLGERGQAGCTGTLCRWAQAGTFLPPAGRGAVGTTPAPPRGLDRDAKFLAASMGRRLERRPMGVSVLRR